MDHPEAAVRGFQDWKEPVLGRFPGTPCRKRVLIVDDDPQFIEMLEFHLADRGYAFLSIMNGRAAVRIATERQFDVILLDVGLRDISGYQAARQITDALGERCPKIIIVTGREVAKERGLVLLSGATAVLQKPLDFRQLDHTIETLTSVHN